MRSVVQKASTILAVFFLLATFALITAAIPFLAHSLGQVLAFYALESFLVAAFIAFFIYVYSLATLPEGEDPFIGQ